MWTRRAIRVRIAMRARALALAAACSLLASWGSTGSVAAQSFPDRSLKIVVPQPPGGGFDLVGRLTGDRLGQVLGQAVIVENRPGTGTLVGTDAVAKAVPDGYTLLVGALPNIVLNVGLYPKLPYDPIKDFTPVGMVVSFGYALATRKDLPHQDFKSLVAFAKANPEKVTYASGGRGTGQHIAMAVAAHLAGTRMTHVPYRGAQAAYQDILGGRVDLFFDNVSTALPLIDDGRVNVLATSTPKRHPRLPKVPTLTEAGLGDFEMETWFGIFAPAATPVPVLDRLRAAMAAVVAKPDFATTFEKTGGIPMRMTASEADALVKREMTRWTKLLRDAGVSIE
jgi:tripartite-type tricarboxylate transporter receptor subunit TctC